MSAHITRREFGRAARALLSAEQREEIRRLHDLVEDAWWDGCAARNEGADCCIDEILDDLGES